MCNSPTHFAERLSFTNLGHEVSHAFQQLEVHLEGRLREGDCFWTGLVPLKCGLDDLVGDLDPMIHGLTTALVGLSGPGHFIDDVGELNGTAEQAKVHHGVLCNSVYSNVCGVVETREGRFAAFFLRVCVYAVCACFGCVLCFGG